VVVIDLLRLTTLPAKPSDRVRDAIARLGGQLVAVRRVLRGFVRTDAEDVLILDGRVPNQVALVRILSVAAQLFTGRTTSGRWPCPRPSSLSLSPTVIG
jgi:hypothetical protein